MEIHVYRFIGITPLLMCNIEAINRKLPQWKLGTKANDGDIEKIAEGMTYRENWPKGNLRFPSQSLRSALVTGCKGQKFGKASPADIFKATIFPAEDFFALVDSKGKQLKEIKPHITTGVNRTTKARVNVVRALVENWQAEVPFEIDREYAPGNWDDYRAAVLRIWNRAGGMSGIGAWRPSVGGKFGKFRVEQIS